MQSLRGELDTYSHELSANCYYYMADLTCFSCDPSTALFIDTSLSPNAVYVCQDFCSSIYSSCNDDDIQYILTNTNGVATANEFCVRYFAERNYAAYIIGPNDSRNCFSGVPSLSSSIINNVGICLNPSTSAAWSTVPVSAVVLFVALLLAVVF